MIPLNSFTSTPTSGKLRLTRSRPAPFSMSFQTPPAHRSSSVSPSVNHYGLSSQPRSIPTPPSPLLAVTLRKPQSSYLARYEALNHMQKVKKLEEDKIRERAKLRESRGANMEGNSNAVEAGPRKIPLPRKSLNTNRNTENSAKPLLLRSGISPKKDANKNTVKTRVSSSAEPMTRKISRSLIPRPSTNTIGRTATKAPLLAPNPKVPKPIPTFNKGNEKNNNENNNNSNNEIETKSSSTLSLKRSCTQLELELTVSAVPPSKREKTQVASLEIQSQTKTESVSVKSTTNTNLQTETDSKIISTPDEPEQIDLQIMYKSESDQKSDAHLDANAEEFEKVVNILGPEPTAVTIKTSSITTFEEKCEELNNQNPKSTTTINDMKSQVREESVAEISDQLSATKNESIKNFSEPGEFQLDPPTQFQDADIEILQKPATSDGENEAKYSNPPDQPEPEKTTNFEELGNGENGEKPQIDSVSKETKEQPKKLKRKKLGSGKNRKPKEISENSSTAKIAQLDLNLVNPGATKKSRSRKTAKRIRNKLNKLAEGGAMSDREWLPLTKKDMKRRKFLNPADEVAKQDLFKNQPPETPDKQFASFSKVPLFYNAVGHLEAILHITNISSQFMCFRVSSISVVADRYKIDPKEGHLAPGDFLPVKITTQKPFDEDEIKTDIFKIETVLTLSGALATSSTANQRIWMNTPESKIGVAYTRSILLFDPNDPFFLDCLFGELRAKGNEKSAKSRAIQSRKKRIGINVPDVLQEIEVAQRKIQRLRFYTILHHIWLCAVIFCTAVLIYQLFWAEPLRHLE